jgi:hypothetical protein
VDGYQFIASIIQSIIALAWPAAFVLGVALFRGRLSQLLPFLRLKHKDIEVSFRLEQAEKEVQQLPSSIATPGLEPTPEETNRFEGVAEHSPRAAILEKRAELEQAVRSAVEIHLPISKKSPKRVSIAPAIRLLKQANVIDEKTAALLHDLRLIGNQAAHDPEGTELNKAVALRFGRLADSAIRSIETLP